MRRMYLEMLRGRHQELLEQLAAPKSLQLEGACVGQDPAIFDGESVAAVVAAREICSGCPVRTQCLNWATWNEPAGIWGGQTPRERATARAGEDIITIEERQWVLQLMSDLKSDNITVVALAERYGTTERNIYRWKQLVAEAS